MMPSPEPIGNSPLAVLLNPKRDIRSFAKLMPTSDPRVVSVEVHEGEAVTGGQQLMVIEAMKMEHVIAAPLSGVVRSIITPPPVIASIALMTRFSISRRKRVESAQWQSIRTR